MARISLSFFIVVVNIACRVQCVPYQEPTSGATVHQAHNSEPTPISSSYNDNDDLRRRQFDWCVADLNESCTPSAWAVPTISVGPTYSEVPSAAATNSNPAILSSLGLHSPSPLPNDSSFADSSSSGSRKTKTKVSKGVIAGAVVGAILFVSLISSVLIFCCLKKRRNTRAGGAGGAYAQPMIVYPPPLHPQEPGQDPSQGYGEYFGQTPEQKGFASPRTSIVSAQTPLTQYGEPNQQSPLMGSLLASSQTIEYQGHQPEGPPYHQSLQKDQPYQPQSYHDAPPKSPSPLLNAPMPMRSPNPNMGYLSQHVPPRPYTGT